MYIIYLTLDTTSLSPGWISSFLEYMNNNITGLSTLSNFTTNRLLYIDAEKNGKQS